MVAAPKSYYMIKQQCSVCEIRVEWQVFRRFLFCSWRLGDLRWWESLTVIRGGNKAKRLSPINHSAKTIHHHHHHHHHHHDHHHYNHYHHQFNCSDPFKNEHENILKLFHLQSLGSCWKSFVNIIFQNNLDNYYLYSPQLQLFTYIVNSHF